MELTPEEKKAIAALKRLAKKWPMTLWLYSANGRLRVMKCAPDGLPAMTGEGVDPDYSAATIDIPNDGGDCTTVIPEASQAGKFPMKPYAPKTRIGRTRSADDIHHRTADSCARTQKAKACRHAARQEGRAECDPPR